jgi:hypothetical protein
MRTTVISIGTMLSVGFLFSAWVIHNPTDFHRELFLYMFGVMTACGLGITLIGSEIGN